jgi:hypothetical protein
MADEKKTAAPADAKSEGPDLTRFDQITKNQNSGIEVEIMGPDGKPAGITIRVSGPDSERQKKALQKLQDERLESQDIKPLTAEQIANRSLRGLALSVMSWSKFKLDDVEYHYSEENATKLFNRFPWIKEQVEAKAGSRAAFLKLSKDDAKPLSEDGAKD